MHSDTITPATTLHSRNDALLPNARLTTKWTARHREELSGGVVELLRRRAIRHQDTT